MSKRGILLIGILLLLVLGGQSCQRGSDQPVNLQYRTGSQGIEMNFMPNLPPARIYDLDELRLGIELWNKGAYPSTYEGRQVVGKVHLSGFDPNYIQFNEGSSQSIDRNLYGKDQYTPEGQYNVLYFTAPNIYLPEGVERYTPTIEATSCYEYKSVASPTVCIDPNPYGTNQIKKTCVVKDVGVSPQGGPVAVTRVEEAILKDRVQFKIDIQNVGNGLVVDRDALSSCPGALDYSTLDYVTIYGEISNQPLYDCKPSNKVKLYNGRASVTCFANKPQAGNTYTTPLKLELEYGYSSSVRKQIEIIKTPE